MKRVGLTCTPMRGLVFVTLFLLITMVCSESQAVPSFTRQTGLKCNVCHSNPPELTAFGRKFKLDGYTLTNQKAGAVIEDADLKTSRDFPLSVMLLLSNTAARTAVPGSQSNNAGFPQALSLFLAGRIAPNLGGFVQTTYSHQDDHLTLDNADIRYAQHTTLGSKDLLYGLTLNNSPTVEDVWNSTPAWGYPWLSPESAPSPSASPLLTGALAQDVAGLGAYTMWNDHLYAGITLYRSEHAGGGQPLTGSDFPFNISGVAPYWRLAWQQTWGLNYLEAGTYGIHVNSVPGGVAGARDTYTDTAIDLQYERPLGVSSVSIHAAYIHERTSLDGTFAAGGAATTSHSLDTVRADATYHLRSRYAFTLAGFSTNGTTDALLFAPGPVDGSLFGSPNSSGFVAQAGFWPQENIELAIAYGGYTKFNGASRNYDGFGRNASDNDSLYVSLWLNF